MHQPEQIEDKHIQEFENEIDADLEKAKRRYPNDPNWFLYYLRDLHDADSGAEGAPGNEKRRLIQQISLLEKGIAALVNHIYLDPNATVDDVEEAIVERDEQMEGASQHNTVTIEMMDVINEYFGTIIKASDTYKTMLEKLRQKRNNLRDELNTLQ